LQRAFANLSFSAPIDLQNAGDGSNRLFVAEQSGRIQVFQNDPAVASKTEFLDIRSKLISGGERGLLGLAFHPNYASNGFFYVNYTRSGDGATVVSRFRVSQNANVADATSELILLTIAQPFANHNGGKIGFGPDGFLYIAMGDGGSANDPQGHGQNRQSLLGKILRLDVDSTANGLNYAIPPSNPFVGNLQGYRTEIFAYGFRNPWRFSFDPETGRLWAGDVGQGQREEIDIVTNGGNYGWNTMEGTRCFNPSSGCDQTGLTLPVLDYSHALGASISGGHVYRGSNNPSLLGNYIYGDFISGSLWALQYDGSTARSIDLFSTELNIAAFGVDENRELYFLSYAEGAIYTFVSE
jgi:glucose/arabinose dehydrogenase